MWRVGVKVNEITFVDDGATCRAFESQRIIQLALVLGEEILQRLLGFGFLRQNTLGGHFPDVGGGEVNTVTEAVLQLGQFDPLGINSGNHLIQLFLM